MSFFIALTSGSFVEHVVWERCLWCSSLCLYLEVTCYLTVGLESFEKGIWYDGDSLTNVVWVANPNAPLFGNSVKS